MAVPQDVVEMRQFGPKWRADQQTYILITFKKKSNLNILHNVILNRQMIIKERNQKWQKSMKRS